jgi:hypothetical protein
VHLVEAEGDVQGADAGFLMLPAQVIEQLIGGDSEVPDPTFEEVPGERRFGSYHQLGRVGPGTHLPE